MPGWGNPASSETLKSFERANLWGDWAARLTALLLPFLIFGLIAWLRPFWGPMDDSVHVLEFVPRLLREGVIPVSKAYALNDLRWGMFRPLYPGMAVLIYWPGMQLGPWASYLWNALLVFAIVGGYCSLLARILRLPVSLVLLACASFFYSWDLLQHLSLQEKMVLTFGALLVWLAWKRTSFRGFVFWPLFLGVALLGFSSKASIVIHFSAAIVAFVGSQSARLKRGDKITWAELLFLFGLLFLQVLAFRWIGQGGSYTKQYDFAKVMPNLFSGQGAMLVVPVLATALMLWLRRREVFASPALLVPVAGVCAFLGLFLPWGIQAYVQTVMAPFFAAMLVQLAFFWLRAFPRVAWVAPLCLFALGVTSYRGLTMFGRLSDLGAVTELGPGLYDQVGIRELWMPCEEGSGAMQQFWKASGAPTPEVKFLKGNEGPGTRWLLFDRALCPLPGRAEAPEGCHVSLHWAGKWPKSYRLVRADCR